MEKHIYILSASDRFNYGDLLFPIIALKELKKRGHTTFSNVSIVRSDLTQINALPTKPYSSLSKNVSENTKNVLLIAGGEVLGANWSRLLSFIFPWYHQIYNRVGNKSALEKITRKLMRQSENPLPFTPSHPAILNNFEFIFHSIGGRSKGAFAQNSMRASFSKSLYFSARENLTFKEIQEVYGVSGLRLTPDSAMLMSDHFTIRSPNQDDYLVFQISAYKHDNMLDTINEQLRELSYNTGLKVYFLPLGNCPGHSDKAALAYLYERASYPCKLIEPESIEVLMSYIASSRLYIGTSLHGIITAMSFSVPYLPLNPNLRKVKNYISTWSPPPYRMVSEFSEISLNAQNILGLCPTVLQDNAIELKAMVSKSFDEISTSINQL